MALELMDINCTLLQLTNSIRSRSFDSISYSGNNKFLGWVVSSANYYVVVDSKDEQTMIKAVKDACSYSNIEFRDLTSM